MSVERLTIPDVRIDKNTIRRSIIDAEKVKECAMEIYWRLKEIEDVIADEESEEYDLDRLRDLVEADKEDRVVSKSSVLRLFNMLLKSTDEQDKEDKQEDVPFATYNQTKWERDIAISQLESYGIGFVEDKNPDFIKVTRCKDCQYFKNAKVNNKGFLICPASGMEITESYYCSYAEKENKQWK